MNTEFEIISQARNPCKINLAKYNHNTMEFITFGPGYFVVCLFIYKKKIILFNSKFFRVNKDKLIQENKKMNKGYQ